MLTRLLIIFCLIGSCALIRAEGNTPPSDRALLSSYASDLVSAWRAYPSDTAARDAQVRKVTEAFNKAITTATPPQNLTLSRAIDSYLDYMDNAQQLFKGDPKMQSLRSTYTTACTTVFKKEVATASDLNATLSTQQCFEQLMDLLGSARNKLSLAAQDLKNQCYTNINTAMNPLFDHAKAPASGDPIAQYDQNVKEAKSKYPAATAEMQKSNSPILNLLLARAKQIQDKSKAP